MDGQMTAALEEICRVLGGYRLPRWAELPDLELYMDQVLALMERYLGAYPGADRKGLTASMVNNYVKLGVMPPPVNKRYSREHLAYLIGICLLKPSLPIAAIQRLFRSEKERNTAASYDVLCALFEQSSAAASTEAAIGVEKTPSEAILRAALRAQAEQALALRLCEALGES